MMKLKDLLINFEYTVQGNLDTEISDIIYDSRKVEKGTAFVCLKGYTSDGHRYAKSAVEKGASALVISDSLDFEVPSDVAVVKVDDTRYALSLMSIEFFGHPEDELYTVAITGTKGKTTTTAMVAEIFEHAGIKTGTIGTLGVVYGGETHKTDNTTPESYIIQKSMRDMINAGCKAMVIEASSIGLKHSRLAGMTFDVGIFTNFRMTTSAVLNTKTLRNISTARVCFSDNANLPLQILTIPHGRISQRISRVLFSPTVLPTMRT